MAVVLAGYLVALGTTPAGAGLRLLGHLAHAHGAPTVAAPAYRPDPTAVGLPVLPTLRASATHAPDRPHAHGPDAPSHDHGSHQRGTDAHGSHAHGPDGAAPPRRSPGRDAVRAHAEAPADAGGLHHHGDTVHTHETPTPSAALVMVHVSVDTHRLPEATRVPVPTDRALARHAGAVAALRSADGSVETPPPIERG